MPDFATCRKSDCAAAGDAIDVTGLLSYVDTETNETITVSAVICGTCGEDIPELTHTDD